MNKQEQIDSFNSLVKIAEEILLKKGDDYADADRLSNFKKAGSIIGISAEKQCLSLIATKVARLGNLLAGNIPNYESIDDTIIDLFNYTALLYMISSER